MVSDIEQHMENALCHDYYILAWSQGCYAYQMGQPPKTNPYPMGLMRLAWHLGWAPEGSSLKTTLLVTWKNCLGLAEANKQPGISQSETVPWPTFVKTERAAYENFKGRRAHRGRYRHCRDV